jgi:hypothetical protein
VRGLMEKQVCGAYAEFASGVKREFWDVVARAEYAADAAADAAAAQDAEAAANATGVRAILTVAVAYEELLDGDNNLRTAGRTQNRDSFLMTSNTDRLFIFFFLPFMSKEAWGSV